MQATKVVAALMLGLAISAPAQQVVPLWPNGTPEPTHFQDPERDVTRPADRLIAGGRVTRYSFVSSPTMTVFAAGAANNSGTAVVVFPGGAYRILAYDAEGTEVCTWLRTLGVTCLLVKYRVPETSTFPQNVADLEDAQQAIRIARSRAAEWHIQPQKIGVLGFSAGAHLAILASNHPTYTRPGAPSNPLSSVSAKPDFAIAIYPAYLASPPALEKLNVGIDPSALTPPTFLVQAEDDPVHVENALVYYRALKELHVESELHVYSRGGHGFGLRPTELPITDWPELAATWMRSIHMLASR